jgi:hypothetical protein
MSYTHKIGVLFLMGYCAAGWSAGGMKPHIDCILSPNLTVPQLPSGVTLSGNRLVAAVSKHPRKVTFKASTTGASVAMSCTCYASAVPCRIGVLKAEQYIKSGSTSGILPLKKPKNLGWTLKETKFILDFHHIN